MEKIRSRRSYLIKPYYDWIVDSGLTPYLSVNADYPNTKVPTAYVKDGGIILNIKPEAVRELSIDNRAITFRATFAGVEESIDVPLPAVIALFAKETQDGIVFDEQDDEAEGPIRDKPVLKIVD